MFLCTLPGYIEAGAVRGRAELTMTDLDRGFREFLREYHTRPHGETKVAPQERWQHGGFVPRMAEFLEHLDLLLLTVAKMRKVQSDGVRFQGMRYIDPTLAAYVGESVVLRYDPRDLAEVRLFHQGKFLCRAICPELAGGLCRCATLNGRAINGAAICATHCGIAVRPSKRCWSCAADRCRQ